MLWNSPIRACDAQQSQKGLPFVINKVSHGYKNFFGEDDQEEDVLFGRRRLQGCLEDVKCPLANGWEAPIRSVAKTYDGQYVCSGQLIGNAAGTDTPYFLTANHCVSQANKAAGMVFYWNYECSTCGGSSCTGTRVSTSGSSIAATNKASDMTLLLQTSTPPSSVFYSGWDRGTAPASSVTCIHHASGGPKKIVHEYDPVVDGSNSGWGPDHWRVTGWDEGGTTLGGSYARWVIWVSTIHSFWFIYIEKCSV